MSTIYEELEHKLQTAGPAETVALLCERLKRDGDYRGLFYAMLLAKRLELGISPVQVGPADNIPPDLLEPYEGGVREAARLVGDLFLQQGDVAWPYFRMIQEPGKVVEAIDQADPEDSEQTQQIVQIALNEGVHPRKGFALVIKRYGICNAITTLSQGFPGTEEDRNDCVKQLIRALYEELHDRLRADIESRGEAPPENASVRQMILGWPQIFGDEFYHIDVSHLSSIVQFAGYLPPCPELELALELCEYGQKLSGRFQYPGDPPFEDTYVDYHVYFRILLGRDVEEGLAHFRQRAEEADPEEIGLYPAVVYVKLLMQLGRFAEATEAYSRYLAQLDPNQPSAPSLAVLCDKIGDYRPMVEVALRRGNLVDYTAALLQQHRR